MQFGRLGAKKKKEILRGAGAIDSMVSIEEYFTSIQLIAL